MTTVTNAELQSAPDDVIRATLIFLCDNDADLRARVTGVFRVASVAGAAGQKKRKAGEQELPAARRQKLEELRMCIVCEKPYLESENVKGKGCWYHPEDGEVNEESWVWGVYEDRREEMGEDPEVDRDTPDNRREYPEGFWHTCCEEGLGSTGCRWGRHYATMAEQDNDLLRDEESPSEGDPDSEDESE